MRSFIANERGQPQVFLVKGGDPSEPDKLVRAMLEVRSGGQVVARSLPPTQPSSAPPPPPSGEGATAWTATDALRQQADRAEAERVRQEAAQRAEWEASQQQADNGSEGEQGTTGGLVPADPEDAAEAGDANAERQQREEQEARDREKAAARVGAGGRRK